APPSEPRLRSGDRSPTTVRCRWRARCSRPIPRPTRRCLWRPRALALSRQRLRNRAREAGRTRPSLDKVEDSKKMRLGPDHGEARLVHEVERLTIPVTADHPRVGLGPAILIARRPRAVTATVLDQQDPTPLLTHSAHLAQRLDRIGKGAGR